MTPTEETFDTRVKLGLTRASFAELLGVRPAQVRKWEAVGQPDPSNAALAAMRLALRVQELQAEVAAWERLFAERFRPKRCSLSEN